MIVCVRGSIGVELSRNVIYYFHFTNVLYILHKTSYYFTIILQGAFQVNLGVHFQYIELFLFRASVMDRSIEPGILLF